MIERPERKHVVELTREQEQQIIEWAEELSTELVDPGRELMLCEVIARQILGVREKAAIEARLLAEKQREDGNRCVCGKRFDSFRLCGVNPYHFHAGQERG